MRQRAMRYVFLTPGMLVANWRTVWPAEELARRGWDVGYFHQGVKPPRMPRGATTFVLHFVNQGWTEKDGRTLTCLDLAKSALARGELILQFDDDWTNILEIEPRPWREAPLLILRQLPELVGLASRVVVATPRLYDVYSQWNPDVRIAENYLPESIVRLPRRPRRNVLAWMGSTDVHGRDLMQLEPYARQLPPLRLIGAGEGAARIFRHWGTKEVEATDPTLDQEELYSTLGEARAAIVPLRPSPFNLGKSWNKPMEFLARGVAGAVQAHPEYVRLADRVGGLELAETPGELVERANFVFEQGGGDEMPQRLLDTGTIMEKAGGDAWEAALAA